MKTRAPNGIYYTQELFYEFNNRDAPLSLREPNDEEGNYVARSGKKYKSVPHIYRNSVDEYDAAMKILGSYDHWKRMVRDCKWFTEGAPIMGSTYTCLEDWREEMRLRDASTSKALLVQSAADGNVTAQRYLHETSTKSKGAGRPAKSKPTKDESSDKEIVDFVSKLKERKS